MFLLTRPTVKYESSYRSYIDELGDSERYLIRATAEEIAID